MGSSSCIGRFAFSWRIIPKAFRIKAPWESWNYQFFVKGSGLFRVRSTYGDVLDLGHDDLPFLHHFTERLRVAPMPVWRARHSETLTLRPGALHRHTSDAYQKG